MLLLVVLLAQALPPADDCPPISPLQSIAELHRTWESANSACRNLPRDSMEARLLALGARSLVRS